MNPMPTLCLFDRDPRVTEAFTKVFEGARDVRVYTASFPDVIQHIGDVDAVVSPANSYGIMDGGIDLPLARYFGSPVVASVQDQIERQYAGEQPVGTCLVVPTYSTIPYLMHAPTMPTPRSIVGTENVYQAFRSVLLAARDGGREMYMVPEDDRYPEGQAKAATRNVPIRSILCPGLGTGTGRMDPYHAANQMLIAWRSFVLDEGRLYRRPTWESLPDSRLSIDRIVRDGGTSTIAEAL